VCASHHGEQAKPRLRAWRLCEQHSLRGGPGEGREETLTRSGRGASEGSDASACSVAPVVEWQPNPPPLNWRLMGAHMPYSVGLCVSSECPLLLRWWLLTLEDFFLGEEVLVTAASSGSSRSGCEMALPVAKPSHGTWWENACHELSAVGARTSCAAQQKHKHTMRVTPYKSIAKDRMYQLIR
jgi:hypothetical protein